MNENEPAKRRLRPFDRGDARATARCAKPQWEGLSGARPVSPQRTKSDERPGLSGCSPTQTHTADLGRHAQRYSGMGHAHRRQAVRMSPSRAPTERWIVFLTGESEPDSSPQKPADKPSFSTSATEFCCRTKKQYLSSWEGMPGRRRKDVQKQYGISHRRWNAYMKALHGNGSESDGWDSDVEREVSRETEEMGFEQIGALSTPGAPSSAACPECTNTHTNTDPNPSTSPNLT